MIFSEIEILNEKGVFASFTTRKTTAKRRREALARQAYRPQGAVIWPYLVHGTHIQKIGSEALGRGMVSCEDTDGCITDVPGVCLTVTCGDCTPIYAWDPEHRAIGLAHAGWRGTLAGIAAELVSSMQKAYGSRPEAMKLRIGPGIDACCFKVKEDCYDAFLDKYPWAEDYLYRWPDGSFSLDIKGINLEILTLCGVEDAIASERCTCCEPDTFYSWRRCGERNRMLAYMYLDGEENTVFKPSAAISRCLTGEPCRYDAKSKSMPGLDELKKKFDLVCVCPEQLGGLSTPRNASEIRDGKVIMKLADKSLAERLPEGLFSIYNNGEFADVTAAYEKGAEEALRICAENGVRAALLKSKSPSCGLGCVYDGSFSRTLTDGDGITAALLKKNGIETISSDDADIADKIAEYAGR